ncbi:MAG: glycosyltransferase family 2 protein [Acidobacteriota bacterium]|nr:glycosyltransferase family 2 protein [Acidobacteriota bacterium]
MTRSLSIVIPAYNEEARLPETLRRVIEYLNRTQWTFWEILIVDDGSTDGTVARAEEFARAHRGAHSGIRVLRNPGNRDKGYSVRNGMLKARGEWTLFTDADLSAPIEELDKLWNAVSQTGAAGAIGSRALDRSLIEIHQPFYRETLGKFFNLTMRAVVRLHFADTQCGFKLFDSRAARAIFGRQRLDRFGFDVEVQFIARKLGLRMLEIPVRWSNAEGSKVGMLNGAQSFLDLFVIRLNQLRGRYR